jgi:diguanylate cyclase (GGDEF)-like protein
MRPTISQNSRVLVLIASLAVASFAVGGLVYSVTKRGATALEAMATRMSRLDALEEDLSAASTDAEAALGDYVLSRSAVARTRFDAAVNTEAASAAQFRAVAFDFAEGQVALAAFEAASKEWRDRVAAPAIRAVPVGDVKAIELYTEQAANDRSAIDGAMERLDRVLARGHAAIELQRTANDGTTLIGVVVGFGFMLLAFAVAIVAVRRFGHALERDTRDASVLNRFTEVTSFADDDRQVAAANLIALGRLARPDASVTHVLNRSMDRADPEASTGDAIAEVLPMRELNRCAGIQRGTMYVTDDLADALSVHCPIYPASFGTLACIPLISGESVGAVHLYWRQPNGLPLERRSSIARITEHAALAIGNRRLLAALHGQANTDARTGLANSRSFDLALEAALNSRAGDEVLSVLMLDIDRFKDFNDRHGHPAGDEALRVFASTLRSCMRDGDIAARYGGEEFAVFLPGIDRTSALVIAERIRLRTEATIVSLAPGLTDRITISAGVATAPDQGSDRLSLLRLADQALYVAKSNGRNRVESLASVETSSTQELWPEEALLASGD